MSILRAAVRRLSVVLAACTVLTVAAPSQAAVVAVFDPAFGASIPNLGFRGSITLDVTAGCYALGTGFQFIANTACSITPLSAEIDYYNATTNSNVLTSVALAGTFFAPGYVFGAYFDPATGQLAGLDTNDSGQFGVTVTDPNVLAPIDYSGSMLLYFASGQEPIQINRAAFVAAAPAATVPGVGGAFLVNCNPANQQESFCSSGDPTTTSAPGRLTFTTVPEPESISLAMIGLLGLVAVRRRARDTSIAS